MMTRTQCVVAGLGLGHAVLAEVLDDVGEELGRGGEVEEAVAAGVELSVELGELRLEAVVACGVVEVHGEVVDVLDEGVELGVGGFDTAALDDAVLHVGGEVVAERAAGDADDGEFFGKKAGLVEVIERGQELALGEVAGGAEDDDDAGVGDALALLGVSACALRCASGTMLMLLLLAYVCLMLQRVDGSRPG